MARRYLVPIYFGGCRKHPTGTRPFPLTNSQIKFASDSFCICTTILVRKVAQITPSPSLYGSLSPPANDIELPTIEIVWHTTVQGHADRTAGYAHFRYSVPERKDGQSTGNSKVVIESVFTIEQTALWYLSWKMLLISL
ncbi:hypothetical protein CDAR_512991 [Caerostris darwini]|uniref:Uncharacterized protein n=1 Tax=Caerostris darwini TaxID=1538125 RepID=A0AAV4RZF2_9ARAC|nr:hypothetical protein CDAR_512991 [Caerostris darwini]